jgi:hypothetical protein
MVDLNQLERYVWWMTTVGYLLLLLKVWKTGLFRVYRFFTIYLLFRVVRAGLLVAIPAVAASFGHGRTPFANNAYAWTWISTQPIIWFLYILVVLELYTLVLQNHKGLASLGRWVLMTGLFLALLLSALTLPTDLSNPGEQFPILRYFVAIGRGVDSSLVVFLLLITGFLAWYPVPLSRNVVVHCGIYALYFVSASMTQLIRNLTGNNVTQAVNVSLSAVTVVCLLLWLCFLNPQGEQGRVSVRSRWSSANEDLLMDRLAAVNSSLLRAARK